MVRQGSAKPSSTSSNLVVTSKRFPEASASGIFCFYRALFLRSTLQRTLRYCRGLCPVAAALPRGGAVALRSAAIQQQRLAGAERHGGGLCAAEKRPPLPCLRLPGQPDAARKGHCCVYRLLLQPPNQMKTKRSEPCTIQDSDRSDC